jgi:hypothetical protein
MTDMAAFADRIRARYPEGLTGVFAAGGTRTSYILETQRNGEKPGAIESFAAYADYGLDRLFELIEMFLELGGQNMVISLLTFQGFYERGNEYAEQVTQLSLQVIGDEKVKFYQDHQIDPYFAGLDTLLHLPEDHFGHQFGLKLARFQQEWQYQAGRHKLIWEVAAIPLFSFWRAHEVMGNDAQAALEECLQHCDNLPEMNDLLYHYYARAVYGTDLPMPHFYLGANRNGDLKLRAVLPIALLCGGHFRMYYTPYPSLFITREILRAILEDLAFGKPLRSSKIDYSGQVTSELIQMEYQRVQALSTDPESTIGLVRQVGMGGAD